MVHILDPAGPWMQAGSCCFFLSGLVCDILLIRIFLVLAYIWLLTAACTGYTEWPYYKATGSIGVDGIVWAVLNLFVHGLGVWRLLWDERRITFATEDEVQMHRFFYRRGGMQRLEMKQVLQRGRWRRVKAGESIVDIVQSTETLVLLVEGKAHYERLVNGKPQAPVSLLSGMTFDISLLNVFGVYIGFEKDSNVNFRAFADTDCLVYEWTIQELNEIACKIAPAVSSFFRNFVLSQVSVEWEYRSHAKETGANIRCSRGYPEPAQHLQGQRSCDFTDPFTEGEEHSSSIVGVLKWLLRSFSPFMPPGMRHNALPVSGITGRNRILAIQQAEIKKLETLKSQDVILGKEGNDAAL